MKKGITLVSLVITIIVLLILATVAISMAVSSDGLFTKAGQVGNIWNTVVTNESGSLGTLTNKIDLYLNNKQEDENLTKLNDYFSTNGYAYHEQPKNKESDIFEPIDTIEGIKIYYLGMDFSNGRNWNIDYVSYNEKVYKLEWSDSTGELDSITYWGETNALGFKNGVFVTPSITLQAGNYYYDDDYFGYRTYYFIEDYIGYFFDEYGRYLFLIAD